MRLDGELASCGPPGVWVLLSLTCQWATGCVGVCVVVANLSQEHVLPICLRLVGKVSDKNVALVTVGKVLVINVALVMVGKVSDKNAALVMVGRFQTKMRP